MFAFRSQKGQKHGIHEDQSCRIPTSNDVNSDLAKTRGYEDAAWYLYENIEVAGIDPGLLDRNYDRTFCMTFPKASGFSIFHITYPLVSICHLVQT